MQPFQMEIYYTYWQIDASRNNPHLPMRNNISGLPLQFSMQKTPSDNNNIAKHSNIVYNVIINGRTLSCNSTANSISCIKFVPALLTKLLLYIDWYKCPPPSLARTPCPHSLSLYYFGAKWQCLISLCIRHNHMDRFCRCVRWA